MYQVYYDLSLALSLALTICYMFKWHKHFDVHITLIFVLVPVVNLGYALLGRAHTLEEALAVNKLTYIGGCYLQLIIMFSVFSLCDIRLSRKQRAGLTTLSTVVYVSALSIGRSWIFYREITFERVDGAVILHKIYGPMHTVFYAIVLLYFLASVGAILYTYFNKNQVSRKTIYLLLLPEIVAMISFFGGRWLNLPVELLPAAFVVAQAVYLVIISRLCLYNITDSAVDTMMRNGDTGFISFDFHLNYLGSNETAKHIFPALNSLTVDRPAANSEEMRETAMRWLEDFRQDESKCRALYERGDRAYLVETKYLYDDRRKRGYQMVITDDTQDQQYIKLLNHFNTELQTEVAQKTAHIVEMHDQLVLGMATMVESRDNSTGGHIRRTSQGVRLLIAEIKKDKEFYLSEQFCRDIIKAAPMHDLGKIAVDDAVLRKPGRFTPEEFELMKTHASEGARIVREILKGTDDPEFQRVAENVAHYHHERWDGSGYPEGLAGEKIPLEARIMAVADVYDALVSKRVYKESMPFDKAHAIIMDGMGKHFDPRLASAYLRVRPKLEAYYSELQQ